MRKAKSIRITTSGTVIKAPERVKTATGKVMATMTIQAESDKRSPYPLKKIVRININKRCDLMLIYLTTVGNENIIRV